MTSVDIHIDSVYHRLPCRVGAFGYDMSLGKTSYRWEYDQDWLREHRQVTLSADLLNVTGPQYANNHIFGLLQDTMPDRWGRNLIKKRERLLAEQQGRSPKHLNDVDYLLQIDDSTRMGALRFEQDGKLVGNEYAEMKVPPITYLRKFVDMAHEYELQEQQGGEVREEWLFNLYRQGSSLGGARPKANVRDTDGSLWIAKIPSINDDYDVALWEYWAHQLAAKAGIKVPQMKLLRLDGTRYHTLLSKRFDRQGENRIHFASAMTLTGLHDGADATTGNGYMDIVDTIITNTGFVDPQDALKQLYRRVAYYIAIGNHDDHFRNHGFLLTDNGWVWSPAYDINPADYDTQSLLISKYTNDSSLPALMDAAEEYMLSSEVASKIINEVVNAVSQWHVVAAQCGISPTEQKRFAARIKTGIR